MIRTRTRTTNPVKVATLGDNELVALSRDGDSAAYAELWRRHYKAGLAVARSYTGTFDPDDLVSEAFARIFKTLSAGGGPTAGFRPYLFTSIRNTAASWGRARKEVPVDDAENIEDLRFSEASQMAALDQSLAAQAFRRLPPTWQEVLWYTEIEGMAPRTAAPLLGMSPNAVAALAYRAREGLRQAWIQTHLASVEEDSECRWTVEHLGAKLRGNLSRALRKRVDAHLAICERCSIVAEEAEGANRQLSYVLLPLAAGVAGAAAYTAWLSTGGSTAAYAATTVGAGATGHTAHGASSTHAAGAAAGSSTSTAGFAGAGILVAASSLVAVGAIVGGIAIASPHAAPAAIGRDQSSSQATPAQTTQTTQTQTQTPAPKQAPSPAAPPSPAASPSPAAPTIPVQPPVAITAPVSPTDPAPAPASVGIPDVSTPNPPSTESAPGNVPTSVPSSVPGTTPTTPVVTVPTPILSSPTAGALVADSRLAVSGTGTAGGSVSIRLTQAAGSTPLLGAAGTVTPSGTWTAQLDLSSVPDGVYILAVAESVRGNVSGIATRAFVEDRSAAVPTVSAVDTGPRAADGELFPVVSGTAEPGAVVTATTTDGVATSTHASSNGSWSMTVSSGIVAGQNTLAVTQRDAAGNASGAMRTTFTLAAPMAVLSSSRPLTVLTVTGVPGAHVELSVGGRWFPLTLDASGSRNIAWPSLLQAPRNELRVRYALGDRNGPATAVTLVSE